jgi:hypothetical protein
MLLSKLQARPLASLPPASSVGHFAVGECRRHHPSASSDGECVLR